jgi:hypothetical protein
VRLQPRHSANKQVLVRLAGPATAQAAQIAAIGDGTCKEKPPKPAKCNCVHCTCRACTWHSACSIRQCPACCCCCCYYAAHLQHVQPQQPEECRQPLQVPECSGMPGCYSITLSADLHRKAQKTRARVEQGCTQHMHSCSRLDQCSSSAAGAGVSLEGCTQHRYCRRFS